MSFDLNQYDLIYLRLFETTILHIAKTREDGRWFLRLGPGTRTNPGFVFDLTQFRRIS